MSDTIQAVDSIETAAVGMGEAGKRRWRSVWVGMLPFILVCLAVLNIEWPRNIVWIPQLGGFKLLVAIHFGLSIGVGIAYYQSFPRWSFSYIGFVFFSSLWLMNIRVPPGPVYGIKAWLVVFLSLIAAGAMRRSITPVGTFFKNIWEDWTLLTFAFFGACPLFAWLMYDEVNQVHTFAFMAILSVFYIGGAYFYLISQTITRRFWALFVSLVLAFSIQTVTNAWYWHGRNEAWMRETGDGRAVLGKGFIVSGVLLAIIFSPAVLGAFRRLVHINLNRENNA
ncbi:MAG: hypothetical protein JXR73_04470 [Candidatus Omnitrophica bacterium]|nr:hypothetical protein [Candidatus Omnitrophota bacterium]